MLETYLKSLITEQARAGAKKSALQFQDKAGEKILENL